MRIPTFTIEAPGLNQQVTGVEFQPIDPAAYQHEAGWVCTAEIDGETVEYFIGAPYGYEKNNGLCTIQRYHEDVCDWIDIPNALITEAEWEEV